MTDAFPTPFARYESVVRPEWIDGNGHMNLAYYVLMFDEAIDLLFDAVGFGAAHRTAVSHGPFAVETHTLYEREVLHGERVRVAAHVLAVDAKRLHVAQEMYRVHDDARAAMQEVMYLHVDLAARRVAPFPPDLAARLATAAREHATLAVPDWIGRCIAMPAARARESSA